MKVLKSEQGAALLVALGALVIISILGVAVLTTASGNVTSTFWDRSSNQAFQVAEGGFNHIMYKARVNTLSPGTYMVRLANGEASITVSNLAGIIWNVKATGAVPNFAAAKAKRAVEGKVTSLNPYEMYFVSGGVADQVEGNAAIDGPFYVRDLLKLSGSGPGAGTIIKGPLFIKDNPATNDHTGDLEMSGDSQIGTPSEPIYAFIDGTYKLSGNARMYTTAIYSDVPDLTIPVLTNDPSSIGPYRTGANVVIDNNSQTDGSRELRLDKNAGNQTHGDYPGGYYLKWTKSGNNGTLEINGKIFVDGRLRIGDSNITSITFTGRGSITANGEIAIESQFIPSGGGSTFPATNAIGFITPNEAEVDPRANDQVYAVIYAYEKLEFNKQMDFWGSGMTSKMEFNSNPTLHMVTGISASLPPGMPSVIAATLVTDWREVKP